jgi:hypothetical protein
MAKHVVAHNPVTPQYCFDEIEVTPYQAHSEGEYVVEVSLTAIGAISSHTFHLTEEEAEELQAELETALQQIAEAKE